MSSYLLYMQNQTAPGDGTMLLECHNRTAKQEADFSQHEPIDNYKANSYHMEKDNAHNSQANSYHMPNIFAN